MQGEGGNLGGCSPNLKPYEAALMNEVEKATERCVTLIQNLSALVDLGRVLELISYLLNAVQMWGCIIFASSLEVSSWMLEAHSRKVHQKGV
jgi:hypothetical protein